MDKFDNKMSFFTKIFQNKKNCRTHQCKWTLSNQSKGWSPPSFDRDSVRLVVIVQNQHTMGHGGRVLFDSKSEPRATATTQDAKKRPMTKSQCSMLFRAKTKPPCGPSRGQHQDSATPPSGRERRPRLASDIKVLEEMMFGSAPIIPKGSSLKVHTTKRPSQVMVTKLFLSTDSNQGHISSEQECFDLYSMQSTLSAESTPKQIISVDRSPLSTSESPLAQSVPVDVPMHSRLSSEDTEDSGFSASMASSCGSSFTTGTSGYSPCSSVSVNSVNSLTRRLLRNQATSLESHINKRFSDEQGEPMTGLQRPSRLGIGITFSLPDDEPDIFRSFENFFFSHITLIESHVVKLKVAVEKALQKSNKHMVIEALDMFRSSVYDLYTAPRLSAPVWLNMMQYSTHQVALSSSFLKDFVSVIDKYDTKNNKFFMSTLITAVLTHHLAWVPTVTPAGAMPARTYLDKHSAKWLDALAKSHPYNPLWAQLGDLYGAVGFPLRLSRTVIVGQKADLVCKILHVLSYFIRCSEVHENVEFRKTLDNLDGHVDIPGSSGMHTIAEDNISEIETSSSGDKNFGSHTSFGTIRHLAMQTSTETVFSAKSDGTVSDRVEKKGLSGSCDELCVKSNKTVDVNVEKKSEDDPSFCPNCRTTRTNVDTIHRGTKDWSYGKSVFYCCKDIVQESCKQNCQCKPKATPNKDILTCDISESDTSRDKVEGDINELAKVKALKLFRMLSHDPEKENQGEENVCESSFSNFPASSSAASSPPAKSDCKISSVPLLRTTATVPEDLFSLHVQLDPSKEPISGSIISAEKSPDHLDVKEDSKCKLSPNDDNEKRVSVDRIRHVGREATETSKFTFETPAQEGKLVSTEDFVSNECVNKLTEQTTKEHSLKENIPKGLMSTELATNGTSKPLQPADKLIKSITGQVPQQSKQKSPSPILPTVHRVDKATTTTPVSASSLYPSLSSHASLDCQIPVALPSGTQLFPEHANLDQALLENPSLHEEPGSVRLVKQDPGTLYPKISGNTLMSSLTTPANHCVDVFGPRLSAIGFGLEVIPDVGEDEVFQENDQVIQGNDENKSQAQDADQRSSGTPAHQKVQAWLGSYSEEEVSQTDLFEKDELPNEDHIKESTTLVSKDAGCQPSVRPKVNPLFGRSNSLFDEYFTEDSSELLPDPTELPHKPPGCMGDAEYSKHGDNFCSHFSPGDSPYFLPEPLHGPLSMLDEYFTDEADAVGIPEGPTKDNVTSTLSLMANVADGEDFNLEAAVDQHHLQDCVRARSDSESSQPRASRGHDRQPGAGGAVSRQNSLGAATPARCRSVTPTELGRRRHLSSTSNVSRDVDAADTKCNSKEVPMPRTLLDETFGDAKIYEHNFGHSLMAGYTDHYMSDFVLHGTSDNNFLSKLHTDLTIAVQNSVLDEQITQACCIVADTDKWTVRLHSSQNGAADRIKPAMELMSSQLVSNILESIHKLWKLKMSPEFCLMHLEDRLQEIYFKSKMLSEYILVHRKIDYKELTTMLGLDVSDLPLLLAVAGTHTPTLALAFTT